MRRVARRANTISPSATIQVTTIEFVIGMPNGRAISTALCESPCSAASGTPAASASPTVPATSVAASIPSRAALAVGRVPGSRGEPFRATVASKVLT